MREGFKKKSLTRLKKARGQIDGIIKMIDEDKYCVDILTQILALQGAIKGVQSQVLESHMNTCGLKKLASKDEEARQQFIQEIIKVCGLSNR